MTLESLYARLLGAVNPRFVAAFGVGLATVARLLADER